jgi:hypothetical protein
MLAAALLVAGLFGAPRPVHSAAAGGACPGTPVATVTAAARRCPAVEISGRADATGLSLDPAFDVEIDPEALARPVEGGALLTAFASDGRTIFALPIAASGAFHLYVPLATSAMDAIDRISLTNGDASVSRTRSASLQKTTAELISTDDDHVIVAWDARAFPAIRVKESPDRAPVGTGNGTSTFEQLTVNTRAHRLYIEFSDGVRSFTEAYAIFGR